MEDEVSQDVQPEPVEDAVDDPNKHLRELVAAGDFKAALQEVRKRRRQDRKSAANLRIDPVALWVLGVCAAALIVIAAATLFH